MNAASEYHWFINVARSAALVVAIVALSGCVTADTIESARTNRDTIKSGEVVINYRVKPRYSHSCRSQLWRTSFSCRLMLWLLLL